MSTAVPEYYEPLMPLAKIVASKTNPRTHFPDTYIAELAGSIADKGVIQPIVVRPLARKDGHFEVVAGECRYRGSKQAGVTTIPALVREYTDDQVLEVQLIENIHRNDLTPMEQARGYRRLIDSNPDKHSAESIATRIGMSISWVWDRLKLNDLIPEAVKILEAEKMTVGHAILVARQTPANQNRIIAIDKYGRQGGLWMDEEADLEFDSDIRAKEKADKYYGFKPVSVRELEAWIAHHIRFDVDHAAKAQPLVFETTAAAVAEAESHPGRGKKVIAITHEFQVADDAKDSSERTFGSKSWRRADGLEKSKTCDHSVLGVFVAGPDYGKTRRVCIARDKCGVHFAEIVKAKMQADKLRATGKPTQAAKREAAALQKAEDKRLKEERERKAEEAAWEAMVPELRKQIVAHLKSVKFNAKLLGIVDRHMFPGYMDLTPVHEVEREFGVKLSDKTAPQVFALMTVHLQHDHAAEVTCTPLGFSVSKFKAAFMKAHPELQAPEAATTAKKPAKKGKAA